MAWTSQNINYTVAFVQSGFYYLVVLTWGLLLDFYSDILSTACSDTTLSFN